MNKPIILSWPNGGMGNAIYTLLCLCTEEISVGKFYEHYPQDGTHWHDISRSIKTDTIVKVHPDVHPEAITIGSENFYLIRELHWAKLEGYPSIKNAEQLELLHLFLNEWKPTITRPNFDIERLFANNAQEIVIDFIQQLGLTPNKNLQTILNLIVENNKMYYNTIQYLQEVTELVLNRVKKGISVLSPHHQALLMTMVYHQTCTPFKLVYKPFANTNDIWNSMEKVNGKAV